MQKYLKNIIHNKKNLTITIIITILILTITIFVVSTSTNNNKQTKPEIITVSTLEKIINVSKLSTFTAVYNGIAVVHNENKPDEIDYYVSYEAKVDAGINFKDIAIQVDNEEKIISVLIPDVYITDVNVDISTLDYIFINNKANTTTVTQTAFKACEADVKNESMKQDAIFELANQSAINILNALINPILSQMDDEYTLIIE